MSGNDLVHWGAAAAVAAGVCGVVSTYLLIENPFAYDPQELHLAYEATFTLQFPLQLLTLLAIAYIHRPMRQQWGRFGQVAFAVAFAGSALITLKQLLVMLTFVLPVNPPQLVFALLMAPGTILSLVGLPLLGVAVLRAAVMPRWFGWVLTLTVPISIFVFNLFLGEVLAAVAGSTFLVATAVGLWRQQSAQGRSAVPATA